jgi:hypothetical protein
VGGKDIAGGEPFIPTYSSSLLSSSFPPIATPTDSAVFYKRYKTAKPTFGVFKYKIRAYLSTLAR